MDVGDKEIILKLVLAAVLSYFTSSFVLGVATCIKDKDYIGAITSGIVGFVILFVLWIALIYDIT